MLASQIVAPRKIEWVDVPEPQPIGSGAILFRPQLGALCGSDMLYFEGDYPEFRPRTGHSLHEIVGEVLATTGGRFRPGERVLCIPAEQDGLRERFWIGEQRAVPLLPDLPFERAVLAQPLGTVLYALRKLPSPRGRTVAVVGLGPIGQLFCAAFASLGARRILAIDPIASRAAASFGMGATDPIHATAEGALDAVRRALGEALPSLVVEAVGHREQQLNACIELCEPGGTILAFGAMPAVVDGLEWGRLYRKNLTVTTSVDPDVQRDFPDALNWIAAGRVDVSKLITHRFGVGDLQRAFDTCFERRDGALKVLIDFDRRERDGGRIDGGCAQ